jgi:PPP family 3-phenylpropionic acid transporter
MTRLRTLPSFAILYAALYAAFGVASPFWPQYFETRGLTPEQLGALLGLGTAIRLIAGPIANRVADLLAALRSVLAICLALSVISALGLLRAEGFWLLLAIHLLQASALAPTTTISDALATHAAARLPRFEYGWVRGTASAAFVAGTLTAGQVLSHQALTSLVWMHATLLVGAILAVVLVPAPELRQTSLDPSASSVIGGVRELLQLATFRRVIFIAALIYGSHAMHDAFSIIRWTAAGVGAAGSSILWSEAVIAEVVVFVLIGPSLLSRFGPAGAAALAAMAGVVRWAVEAETANIGLLAIVQPLHGFTFALMHLACMRVIADRVPSHLLATAQALYALGPGLVTAVLVWLSGGLYSNYGPRGFLMMAALCVIALMFTVGLRDRTIASPVS